MKRILLLGYILFLLCGYTYSQQRVDPRYYPGVLINGIYWSEYNVDAPETFTDSPEGYGLFYYWNSKIAIPRIGNIDTLIWSRNDYWEEVNNPCPDGWRVPTEEEVLTLDDKTKVDAEYIQLNDINGWKFTDNTTKDSIFFPMAGFRDYFQNLPQYENLRGSYYTNQASRLGGYNIGFIFELIDKRWYPNIIIREARVASVRCVRERPPCDSIVRDIFVTICEKDLPYKFGDDTTFGKGTVSGTYTFHRIQALTGCDSIVHLHLTVAQEAKPCPGVLINGVCWARSNVDAPGTFAHTPEADGMLYQWNRKKGWSPTGDISGWDANLPSGDNWNKTNDPCPAGWRVPNAEEINTLLDESKVNRLMTTQTGIFGGKFTDKGNGNAVFFPVVNHRKPEDGSVHPGDFGYYWSASPANTDEAWALYCYMETAFFKTELPKNGGYSLRCVAGEDISDCKIVTEEAYDTICAHDLPYTWRDTLFYRDAKTGVYLFRRIQALTGCDSIVQLHLTVQDIPPLEFSGEVCQGENYNEYGFNLPKVMKDTIVCDTLKTRWGCDSIRILYLTVHPKHETIVYDTVCQGEPYHGYGFTLTNTETSTEGTITRDSIYKDIHGCDSLVTLNLFVSKSYIFKTEREICQGDTVMWRGKVFKESVIYDDSLTTVHGCDSVYRLLLTVHPVYDTVFPGEVCQGNDYSGHGFKLPAVVKDTIVRDTLKTQWGCDSIRTLYLSVHPLHDTIVYDTICEGESYNKHGVNIDHAQPSKDGKPITVSHTCKSIHGCDSLVTLNLFVGKSYLFKTEREICQGDTVMWRGKPYDKEGTYEEPFTTVHGCDSVYRLLLTVHPVYDTVFPGEVCQGNDYSGYGFHLPAVMRDTIVRDTLKTLHGCDSICTLYLSVHPLHDTIVRDTACQGDDYHKHGVSMDNIQPPAEGKPLTPTLPHQSIHGCDSTVHLSLTVHPIYRYTIHDSICPAEPYLKHGFQLPSVTQSGTFPLHLKTIHGCDSTVTLALHVHPSYHFPRTEHICQGETFEFRDKVYATSGFYADTLATVHGCDSVYSLLLSVHPVYDVQLQGVLCEGEEYIRDGFRVREPGTHVLPLSSVHGCDSIVTLTLTEEKKVEGTIGFFLEDCTKHAYGFEFSPSLPVKEWLWDMGDGTTLTDGEGYHRYADSGSYRIQLHTLTPNGCGNDFYHVQRVPPYLDQVDIRADRKVIDEEFPTVRFRAEVLPGMVCEWDFGDGKTAQGNEVTHTYDASRAGMFEAMLRVTNEDGCVTESSIGIEAVVFPKAVNTFSPNGDGINDIFLQGFRIEVMNRNGLKIYNGENGWDGTYKGREAKEDTYFYRVTYRTATGERIKTGFVNLVR